MPRKKKTNTETEVSHSTVENQTEAPQTEVRKEKKTSQNDEIKLDSQTRDLIKRIRNEKLVSGGRDPFFIPEKDKSNRFEYRWASTDKDTPESIEYLEEIGWKKVDEYRTITTGGYTVNGQPGKHILMRLDKTIHNELLKINDELAKRKKDAVFGKEVLSRDGGKNVMGSSTKIDESAKNDFLHNL